MKKYLKMIPVMLYPYMYLICLLFLPLVISTDPQAGSEGIVVLLVGAVVYNVYVLVSVIVNAVMGAKGKYSAVQLARLNLVIKGVQIPAYIFHFILGMIGQLMSVWGIGVIIFAIVIDVLTITLTGINAIGCSIRLYKDGVLSLKTFVLYSIASFLFCIDLLVACIYLVKAKKVKARNV